MVCSDCVGICSEVSAFLDPSIGGEVRVESIGSGGPSRGVDAAVSSTQQQ